MTAIEIDESIQALNEIALALQKLGMGDTVTGMGAVELLAMEIREGSTRIATALESIAEAVNNTRGSLTGR